MALPPPVLNAKELVNAGWNTAQGYASNAFYSAVSFLNDLEGIGNQLVSIPDVTVDVLPVTHSIDDFVMPTAPTAPNIAANFPNAPADPTLAVVTDLSLPDAPLFNAALPDINLNITPPSALTATIPAAPALNAIVLPNDPSITIPDVPSLFAINLPNAPSVVMSDFTDTLDDLASAPSGTFSFIEPAYSSTLLDGMKAFLVDWVNGAATGLSPAVERAIWDRAREREDRNATRSIDTIRSQMAGRGFSVPQGAMATAIMSAVQEAVDKSSSVSREVMIKQAELEQENRHFAVTAGVQLEGQLLTYSNQVAQRAFEVANATLRASIDLYQATVSAYGAKVQAFATKAQVWRQRIEVELSKLEIYKTELEGQKLIGDLNVQQVEVYKARLQGVLANVDVYKAQVEAANVKSAINRSLIESFVAQIQAYGELVKAKATEYEGYATQVKAEVSKADVFKVQADAYKSQVDGYSALTTAKVAEQSAQVKVKQEIPLGIFQARIGAFEKLVSAEAARLTSLNSTYETDGRVFASKTQAEGAKVQAQADVYRSEVQYVIGEANAQIEAAKANVAKMTSAIQLLMESIKAGGQVSAQLAASALSAINLSGSISSNDSASISSSVSQNSSESNSNSNSNSYSENHYFNETP